MPRPRHFRPIIDHRSRSSARLATFENAMPFVFEITSVARLPQAKVAVLEGRLAAGSLAIGASALLEHGSELIGLKIKGVALGGKQPAPGSLSVTVSLSEPAMTLAAAGDRLLSA